jgi:molecular chaperone HscB
MFEYFSFYKLQPAFHLDETKLRTAFLTIQREWHPDFFGTEPDKLEEAMSMSGYNNEAYKNLNSFEGRVRYILQEMGMRGEDGRNKLPADFLADLMDLNDLIDQAADGDADAHKQAETALESMLDDTLNQMREVGKILDEKGTTWSPEDLVPMQVSWQKWQYLSRLKKNLLGEKEY